MIAIKAARKFIEAHPSDPAAKVLADLVLALENESSFALHGLYELPSDKFDLAISVLQEWRLDRYYLGKAKLIDISVQLRELRAGPPA